MSWRGRALGGFWRRLLSVLSLLMLTPELIGDTATLAPSWGWLAFPPAFGNTIGTAALEEDAQILKVIEAYCTSANFQQGHGSSTRKDSVPQVLLPEEEKLIIEETRSNGQTIIEEKSLVDTVYALKDEVKELKQVSPQLDRALLTCDSILPSVFTLPQPLPACPKSPMLRATP
ncbi:hypothetical protein CB1_101323001 [Camelus ferus]|nr:hypothetical protein CB1_101323001 [Camelus ferus]